MKRILSVLLLAILLAFPSAARADIAPPANPPGSNLQPGSEVTQVRMMAETVTIDVQNDIKPESLGQATVNADFTMRNLGSQPESMAVRFPLGANDGFFNIPEIRNFRVKVNGQTVSTRRITGLDPRYGRDEVPWAEFDAAFPPAQDVDINVSYILIGSGYYPDIFYEYILSTGAGWKDSIGSADIILRLPYEVSDLNVIFGGALVMGATPENGVVSGNDIRWHYDGLEPTAANDFHFDLIAPSAWNKVLTERRNVEINPKDGEAWGRLAKIYKEIAFLSKGEPGSGGPRYDTGGAKLYDLSVQAYEKAVALLPNDALWHAGFAELLWWHCCFRSSVSAETQQSELLHALDELRLSVAIDPKNQKANELLDWISSEQPDYVLKQGEHYVFLALTATPLPPTPDVGGTYIAEIYLTSTAEAGNTPAPGHAGATTPPPATPGNPVSRPALPICAGALPAPLILLLAMPRKRK